MVLDKTGTLTQGKPMVTDLLPGEDMDEDGLLILAACLEGPQSTPGPPPSWKRVKRRTSPSPQRAGFTGRPRVGRPAVLSGRTFLGGNRAMMEGGRVELGGFLPRRRSWPGRANALSLADESWVCVYRRG